MKKSSFHFEDVLTDKEAQEDFAELPLDVRVFRWFRFITFVSIFLVGAQMFRIGVLQRDRYSARADSNVWNYKVLEADRGVILDRFGEPLAGTVRAFRAVLFPRELPKALEEREEALKKLSEFFELSTEELRAEAERRAQFFESQMILAENMSEEEVRRASLLEVSGFRVEEGSRRFYANPEVFSHVVGYTSLADADDLEQSPGLSSARHIGRVGLEGYYDAELRGISGVQAFVQDSSGDVLESRIFREPKQGRTLRTSIDKEFQEYFYERVQATLRRLNRSVGVGIAMNPTNGEVLALFGVPGFDPDLLSEYLDDGAQPLFNRAISGLYSPGSVIKPLHGLAALVEGVVAPQDSIYSKGFIAIPNPFDPDRPSVFRDWRAHGWVDMRSALARSSNVYFYEIGGGFQSQEGLGIARLKSWWERFRLNFPTGIDLTGEKGGFLPDPVWKRKSTGREWLVGDTYNVSIGQGDLLLTPLGILSYISALANGGALYEPRVARTTVEEDGAVFREFVPRTLGKVSLDEFALKVVEEGMIDAVEEPYGTAYNLSDLPIKVAAKTGSAQVQGNTKTNAFFVGYGPVPARNYELSESTNTVADESVRLEIAILVLIEDAREGSLNAVPIAKDVFLWYYENRIQTRTNAE